MNFWRDNEPVILLILGFIVLAVCAFCTRPLVGGLTVAMELIALSLLSWGRGE